MSDKDRRPRPPMAFVDAMVEDILDLSDRELRAELEADGTSVEEMSAVFQSVRAGAEREAAWRARLNEEERTGPGLLFDPAEAGSRSPMRNPRARPGVLLRRGPAAEMLDFLPEFETRPFALDSGMREHPAQRAVVRRESGIWTSAAVGTVSRSYLLLQHREVGERCLRQLERAGMRREDLEIEVSFSSLGEWVHLAFILRDSAFVDRHGHEVQFRCECLNSVAGSSPVALWFGWLRPVCGNGMIVGESRYASAPHRSGPRLETLWSRVFQGFSGPTEERRILSAWEAQPVSLHVVESWLEEAVRGRLLSRARAVRVNGICRTGMDRRTRVPGSPPRAETVYDVVQGLSWVFSRESDVVRRYSGLSRMPRLAASLAAAA